MRRSSPARLGAAVVVAALVVAGCSSGDDDESADTEPAMGHASTITATSSPDTSALTTDPTADPTTDPMSPESTVTTEETTPPIATVPDGGVPGIDSDDPFCRAWSEFAGSFQALSLTASFGATPPPPSGSRWSLPALVSAATKRLGSSLPTSWRGELPHSSRS